ncbi:ankyrin repeat domain-containing protein 52 [Seiridium cupressi]
MERVTQQQCSGWWIMVLTQTLHSTAPRSLFFMQLVSWAGSNLLPSTLKLELSATHFGLIDHGFSVEVENCGLSDEYCDDAAEEEDEWLQSKGGNPFDDQDHLLEYADLGSDTDRTQLVSLLIKKGARIETLAGRMPSEHDTKFPSPIVLASKAHLVPILKLLLKAGANACERDDFGDFPLSAAVRSLSGSLPLGDCNPAETVEWLLDHGADANQKDGDGQNALFQLCALPEAQTSAQVKIRLEVLNLLIDRGATTDAKPFTSSSDFWLSSCNASPLHAAFKQGNLEVCDMLIQHGVSFPVAVAEMQEFFDSIVWTGTSKLGESCISINGRPEETGWNSRTKRERVLLEQSWLCARLSYLLCHGDKEALIRHPRSLWLAAQISETPLAEMLIRAGASDVSWTEHDECCESTLASPQALSVRAILCSMLQSLMRDRYGPRWDLLRIFFEHGARIPPSTPGIDEDRFGFNDPVHPLVTAIEEIWTEEDCDNFALAIQMMSVPLAQSRTLAYKLLVAACRSLTQPRIVQCLIREGADINSVPPGAQHIIRYLLDRFDVQLFEHIDGSWVEPRILIDTLQIFIESGAKYQFERFGHNSFYNLLGRHMSYGKSGDSSCTDDKEKEHRERLCQKLQERCILKYRHPADITELTIRDAVEDGIDACQDDSHDGSNDLGPDYSTDDATPMVEIMDQILDRARSLRL